MKQVSHLLEYFSPKMPRNQKNEFLKCPNFKRASKKTYKTCVTPLNMFLKIFLKSERFPQKWAPEGQKLQFKKKFQIWKELEKTQMKCLTHLLEFFFSKKSKLYNVFEKRGPRRKKIFLKKS